MITVPAGVRTISGMPFGLAIMQTAWAEGELIRWASAIEDLQMASGTERKRSLPVWRGYLERNIPVPFSDF
jgi:amidase